MNSLYRIKLVVLPLGLAAIAIVASLSAFQGSDDDTSAPESFEFLADSVNSSFDANELRAEGAPQQQVVAGWAIKDFSYVLVLQGDETNASIGRLTDNAALNSDRIAKLLGLGILALCWIGMWAAVPKPIGPAASSSDRAVISGGSDLERTAATVVASPSADAQVDTLPSRTEPDAV